MNNISIVKLLLENNANTECKTDKGEMPLIIAYKKRNKELMECLINFGADENGVSPYFLAVNSNNNELIHLLNKSKNNIDAILTYVCKKYNEIEK